jgi:hypothetical protein
MQILTEELELALAWLAHALPERNQWDGPAAESCRQQIEQLIHELRAVTL